MTNTPATSPSETPNLAQFLAEPLRVGQPQTSRGLTVFPLFGPEPRCAYLSFSQGRANGVRVSELEGSASVRDLVVENPTGDRILLFEGEEVLGAQQNRTFDVSVLVDPGAKLRVPVSCMEAGRWEGARHRESFKPAPQTANPRLRRMKAQQVRSAVAAGHEPRANQGAVWSQIDEMRADHSADAPTGAMHDVYESRRDHLREICAEIPAQPSQVGSIAAINGSLQVLDYVSRPDAYATLHERLVQGYALDALAAEPVNDRTQPADESTARGFTLLVADSPLAHRTPGVGLGEGVRFAANGAAGSGLVHERELIQLTAFPGDEIEWDRVRPTLRAGRVRRPSRRRS